MTTIIVQARSASTRLPGKVLKKICGKTLLEHLILRLKRVKLVDKIIVATTTKPQDIKIVEIAKKMGVDFFRGSEEDVLDRTYQAAKIRQSVGWRTGGDIIVRISSDCPMADPAIVDKVIAFYKRNNFHYVSNTNPPTFPDGMDVEVFSFKALGRAWKEAEFPSEREHVTAYIYKHPKIFRVGNVRYPKDLSHLRLTVDNPEDLVLVRKIFGALYKKKKYFSLEDILKFLDNNQKLNLINQHIQRNEGYKKSLKLDRQLIAIHSGWAKKDTDGQWQSSNFENIKEHHGAPGSKLRVVAGSYLFKESPHSLVVALGGKGKLKNIPDILPLAEITKRELAELGVPESQIILEKNAGSTYTELKALKKIADRLSAGKIIIVSNVYHLPRIRAMLDSAPDLKEMSGRYEVKVESAEDILLRKNPEAWKKIIERAYRSPEIADLGKKEKKGARQIYQGNYKYV